MDDRNEVHASSSTSPYPSSSSSNHLHPNGEDEVDTSSFEDLSMNAALGINASESLPVSVHSDSFSSTNPLSFKRRQVQQKPLSRFISHLYSPPKRTRAPLPPRIEIPSPHEGEGVEEYEPADVEDTGGDGGVGMDLNEQQGYPGKEMYGDWVSETGLGARKYDDLTAIGNTPYPIVRITGGTDV